MPLRRACGQPEQARHRSVCITICAGGKVPLPSAPANAPPGGRAGSQYRQSIGRSASPLTRRTTSAVSAANECEGITCLRQVTRNDSDEAERSERSPPGVARNAGDEGLAAPGGQVSGKAAPANGSASQVNGSPEASGEVRTGDRARRRRAGLEKGPPEPSANDRQPVCGL